jgi:hypothetical protein
MRGVFIAITVSVYSTCVEQGMSRFWNQTRTENWLSPSAQVVYATLERLHLGCVYIADNRTAAFGKFMCHFLVIKEKVQTKTLYYFFLDSNEPQMMLQFWKFLSRHEKQALFSGPEVLDRKLLCRYRVPLYVILSEGKSTIRWAQQVTTTLMPPLFLQSFVPGTLTSSQTKITSLCTFK